jgi:hypothetical protein
MFSDDLYKAIGFFVSILLFIYLITKVFKIQASFLEGLATMSDPVKTSEVKAKINNSKYLNKNIKNIKNIKNKQDERTSSPK